MNQGFDDTLLQLEFDLPLNQRLSLCVDIEGKKCALRCYQQSELLKVLPFRQQVASLSDKYIS